MHPRVKPQLRAPRRDGQRRATIDWAFGELLAFGSLRASTGALVRLSGQDTRRGTFVQRHSVLIDRETGDGVHAAAQPRRRTRRRFLVYDSLLSRVRRARLRVRLLGGQPGRAGAAGRRSSATSSTAPSRSSTSSSPPARPSGASAPASCCCCRTATRARARTTPPARIERFLQLCAEDNMTVAVPSDPGELLPPAAPAGAVDGVRRPLVVFTPKSMLRRKAAASPVDDFTDGRRSGRCIDDPRPRRRPGRGAAGCCCARGKIYYDLAGRARAARAHATPRSCGSSSSTRCPADADRGDARTATRTPRSCWVQEEPANQGAWPFLALSAAGEAAAGGRADRAGLAARHGVARRRVRPRCTRWSRSALIDAAPSRDDWSRCTSPIAASRSWPTGGASEQVTARVAGRAAAAFVDLNPEFEVAVERLATWLARDDEDELD